MTISKQQRKDDLEKALALVLEQLGDRQLNRVRFNPGEPPFDEILPTSWPALEKYGRIDITGCFGSSSHFTLTGHGWLTAMQDGGHTETEQFNQNLGRLMAALKAKVKGRAQTAFAGIDEIAATSGLPAAFIWNIIESDAITVLKDSESAEWEGAGKNVIKIPIGFGHERL
jgi:hypothetical protein